jgi:hypothetical protein
MIHTLHVGRLAVLGTAVNGWPLAEALGNHDTRDGGSVKLLQPLGQRLEFVLVKRFATTSGQIFVVFVTEFDGFAGNNKEFLALKSRTCWIMYSSTASLNYKTSSPFSWNGSRNCDLMAVSLSTAAM